MFLSKLPDGVFVSGATSMALNRHRADFALYGNGIFSVLRNEFLDESILSTMREPTYTPPPVRYSEDKLSLLFIDTLTYPRPVRKFKMLFGKTSLLAFLRDMMISEVGLEDRDALVLLTKGRKIPNSYDMMALDAIGIKNGQKIIVSRKLGVQEPHNGMTERNRQFVGDLLFGPAGDNKTNANGQSLAKTFKTSHGYQILGRTIERLLMVRFSDAYRKEEGARKSEEELYALLEEEDREKEKEKQKKEKKKEKEKKKKEQQEKKEVPSEQKKNDKKKGKDKGKDNNKDKEDREKDEKDDGGSSSDEDAWILGIRKGSNNDKAPAKNAAATLSSGKANIMSEEQQLQAALKLSLAEAKQQEEEVVVSKSRQKKKKKEENLAKPQPPPVQKSAPQPVQKKPTVPPPAPLLVSKDIKPVSSIVLKDGEKPKYSQVTSQSVNAAKKPTAPATTRSGSTGSTIDSKLLSPTGIKSVPTIASNNDILNSMSNLRVTPDTIDGKNDLSYLNSFFPQNKFAPSIPGLIDNFLGGSSAIDAKSNAFNSSLSTTAPPGLGLGPSSAAPPGLGLGPPTAASPAVKFCPSCGSKLQQSHRFCWNCGSDIKTSVAEVASDAILSKASMGLSGILGDNNLYNQQSATSLPFLDTWNLPIAPISSSQQMSIPGLSPTQGNFSVNEDLGFNVFSNKESSDILSINSMLTSDAAPFVPASLKTQSNPLGGLGMQNKSNSNAWGIPNVDMLMSFLGDEDASKNAADQKSKAEVQGSSRLGGIFNKGGYI